MPAYDLDEFEFSPLHRAVLDLSPVTTEEVLEKYPLWMIDEKDIDGHTALSWAALRSDYETMVLLLRHGADPHQVDAEGRNTMFYASLGHSLPCIRLLLDNGVDVNHVNCWGHTLLMEIAMQRKPKFLDLLLQYQPNINVQDPCGDSALLEALESLELSVATRLIQYGANIHLKENYGFNALSVAVLFNVHFIISLLLAREADHHGAIEQYGSFLHLVAEAADVETLKLLAGPSSSLALRDVRRTRNDGRTPLEVAKSRKNTTLEWQNAFYSFLWSVDTTKLRVSPFESSLSGLEGAYVDDSDCEDVFVEASEHVGQPSRQV